MAVVHGGGSFREREYLFIDGGCLTQAVRATGKDIFGEELTFQANPKHLAGSFDKIFYYDAVPGRGHHEPQAVYEARVRPDHERFDLITTYDRFHVVLGKIVGAKGKNRRQKGVDVRLAVDALTYAFRGNITKATIFAGDADFTPLLQALVAHGIQVTLWHPVQAAADLKAAADSTRPFSFAAEHRCFSFDGSNPAFEHTVSAGGFVDPLNYGISTFVGFADRNFGARWSGSELVVLRGGSDATWEAQGIRTNCSLEDAMKAFDSIFGWGICEIPPGWVRLLND